VAVPGRGELTDNKARAAIEPLLPEPGRRNGRRRDHRQVVNGILGSSLAFRLDHGLTGCRRAA